MTIQTKHFIELSDMVSLRFDCKHCGASLSLSFDDKLKGTIGRCPSCSRPWTALDEKNYEKLFDDFTSMVMNLRDTFKSRWAARCC